MLLPRRSARLFLAIVSALLPLSISAAPVNAGFTTVTFDSGTLGVLTGAGFSLAPIAPATANLPSAVFPIIGGDTTTVINHSGGLAFTKSGITADLENFAINLTNSTLFGQVIVGSMTLNNVALFDLTSSGGNTNLLLDASLASAINQVFSVNLPAGTLIGTAIVTPTPEPSSVALLSLGLLGAGILARKRSAH